MSGCEVKPDRGDIKKNGGNMIRRDFACLLAVGALLAGSKGLLSMHQESKEIELRVEGMV